MDVINMISKVDGLPDAVISEPGSGIQPAGLLYVNGYALISRAKAIS